MPTSGVKKGWFRTMYDQWSPAVQLAGFLIMVSFTVGIYFSQFTAMAATVEKHDTRLLVIENHYAHIEQKLNDLCDYLRVPQRRQ